MTDRAIWSKLLPLLAALAAALLCLGAALAETAGTCGDDLTWALDAAGTLTIHGTGAMDDYVAAPSPWGTEIKAVVIGEGVTSVGKYAFSSCASLTDVALSDSVAHIGDFAFYGCGSLTDVAIPKGVTGIGSFAFANCGGLTDFAVSSANPAYASRDGVLFNKAGTRLIACPEGRAGAYAIPDGVAGIADYAFNNCAALTSVDIPGSVAEIGIRAFQDCRGLTGAAVPEGVTEIRAATFRNCVGLTSVSLPEGLADIGPSAFWNCASLPGLALPDSVVSIGDDAFGGCCGLTKITLPQGVASVGFSAFAGCGKLDAVCVLGKTVAFKGADVFSSAPTIYCYAQSNVAAWASRQGLEVVCLDSLDLDAVRTVALPGDFSLECGESRKLTPYIFPDDKPAVRWTSANPAAVAVEDGLVTAVAPGFAVVTATVGSVSASVVVTAGSPPTLVLPADLAAIEPEAFQNTAALEAVVIPEGCASIGARAFAGCPALRLVTLPGDIAIDETAFADCASVAFRCPLGSAAAAYAEAHGFAVVPAEE